MKRNYWPLFFIGIFSFVFSMIVWTIYKTSHASLDEDRSFMKKYQEVDDNYNKMMDSNFAFLAKYNLEFYLNDTKFDLTTQDIMYSQRVLEKFSKHKNLLKVGQNSLKAIVYDKTTNEKKDVIIELVVTKSNSNSSDLIINNNNLRNDDKIYNTIFEIKEANNWNITGSFKIDETIGYIFIKTNAI